MSLIRYISTQAGRIAGGQITRITPKIITSLPQYTTFKPQPAPSIPAPVFSTPPQQTTQNFGTPKQFQTIEMPKFKRILPVEQAKIANKKTQNLFLDMVLGTNEKDPAKLSKMYTPEYLEKRLVEVPGLAPSQRNAIVKVIRDYIQVREESGGNIIEEFSAGLMDDVQKLITTDYEKMKNLLNDPEVKDGFQLARSASFQDEVFGKTSRVIAEVLDPVTKRLAEVKSMQRELSDYYISTDKDTPFNKYLSDVPNMLGGRLVSNDRRYAKAIESFQETGIAKPDLETARRRRVYQNIERGTEFENLEDIFKNISSETEVERNLRYANQYLDEIHGEIQEGLESIGLKKNNREIDRIVRKGKDILQKVEKFQRTAQGYGSEAKALNTREGHNIIGKHQLDMFKRLEPSAKARWIYRHTPKFNIFELDKSIAGDSPISSEELIELQELYNIDIVFEDEGRIILRGFDESEKYKPLDRLHHKENPLELPPGLLKELENIDDMLNYVEEPFLIRASEGGFLKINGDRYAALIPDSVLNEAEKLELAHDIQLSAKLLSFGIYGERGLVNFFEEEMLPTPRNMVSSSLMSVVQHSGSRLLARRHFFDGSIDARGVFVGDSKQAYKTYKDLVRGGMRPRVLYMDEITGRVHKFEVRSRKDMEHIYNNPGYVVVFDESYHHFMNKVDTFELSSFLKWIDTYVNSITKVGVFFLNIPLLIRNLIDTPLRAGFTSIPNLNMQKILKLMGYVDAAKAINPELQQHLGDSLKLTDTLSQINRYIYHIKQLGGLYDTDAMNEYVKQLPIWEQYDFWEAYMIHKMEISGVDPKALLDVIQASELAETDMIKIFEDKANKMRRERNPNNLAEYVWDVKAMQYIMGLFGKTENLFRFHQAKTYLRMGYTRPQIVRMVNKTFVDYRNKEPWIRQLNTIIPFGTFLIGNMYSTAEYAMDNPSLTRMIVQMGTATTVDEEERNNRRMSDFERQVAMSGNLQIGHDVWMWNPSLFDALGAIPGFIQDPAGRMNLIVKNVEAFLKGDPDSIEYPFQTFVERSSRVITQSIPKMIKGEPLTAGEKFPGLAWTKRQFEPSPRLNRSYYSPGVTAYNRMTGFSVSKMGARYGGRITRSSNYQRKIYLDRGFYSSLYTSTGKSRIAIRSQQKPTYKNLAGRIKDQNYRFR